MDFAIITSTGINFDVLLLHTDVTVFNTTERTFTIPLVGSADSLLSVLHLSAAQMKGILT